MTAHRKILHEYVTAEGGCPFREWLLDLPMTVRARVQARLLRFELGNLGDFKAVGGGVLEARLQFGAGYRIYFAVEREHVILLLIGGDKSSQANDIMLARRFLKDYLERK